MKTKEAKELINVSINELISLASYSIEENTVPPYDFIVKNFSDTWADMYGIDIYKIPKDITEDREHISTLYVDSCGGCLEYETPGAKLTELEDYVLNILFVDRQHGMIREF